MSPYEVAAAREALVLSSQQQQRQPSAAPGTLYRPLDLDPLTTGQAEDGEVAKALAELMSPSPYHVSLKEIRNAPERVDFFCRGEAPEHLALPREAWGPQRRGLGLKSLAGPRGWARAPARVSFTFKHPLGPSPAQLPIEGT